MKMHPSLDEHSQLILKDGRASSTKQAMQKSNNSKRHHFSYLDSSSSSEEQNLDREYEEQKEEAIDIQNHIMQRQMEILNGQMKKKKKVKDSIISQLDTNGLSRGDLSGR